MPVERWSMSVRFSLHLRVGAPLRAESLWAPSELNEYGFSPQLRKRRLEAQGSSARCRAERLALFC